MALVTLKDILANVDGYAVGAFNVFDSISVAAVVEAAEEAKSPLILQLAEGFLKYSPIHLMGKMMVEAAEKAAVPVAVHFDHGKTFDLIQYALDCGFTSVMYDGSALDIKENYANTCIAVELASRYGASVEAEVGSMGAREGGSEAGESIYTDPDTALWFVKETGIDALACAFGTAHGMYLTEPKLDFERVSKIKSMIDVPMVMHGGSGVSPEDYREVIQRGIRKINYYTYMAKAGGEGVKAMTDATFFHDIAVAAQLAMKQDALRAMKVFAGK